MSIWQRLESLLVRFMASPYRLRTTSTSSARIRLLGSWLGWISRLLTIRSWWICWSKQERCSMLRRMFLLVSCLGAWSYHQRRLADPSAAMMIAESVNNTFGRTCNPLNRKLTSGGSSGGESALISFGGSVLGVGTDIGESREATSYVSNTLALKL
jgi:hypothetical protein